MFRAKIFSMVFFEYNSKNSCGACTVVLSYFCSTSNAIKHSVVKSCILPLCYGIPFVCNHQYRLKYQVDGMAITTVEGLGSKAKGFHSIQERLASNHGTQCGFCSPGMVMSLYGLLLRCPSPNIPDIEEALQGNLCRCTGNIFLCIGSYYYRI